MSAEKIAKELTIPTTVFYGEAEGKKYSQLKIRCEQAEKDIKKSKLIVVKEAPHEINYPEYIKAIKKEFS